MLGRLVQRVQGAAGASVAQLAQALTSLVLQVAAARALGADGLGVFALLYGGLILATAIVSGLVGDSLTVLERGRPSIRAGLMVLGLSASTTLGVVGAVVAGATGLLSWPLAVLFGAGVTVFVIEELFRRTLMASLQFWSVVTVDTTCLVVTVVWLGSVALVGDIVMGQLLLALLIAQAVGVVAAIRLLPPAERWLPPWRGADLTAVMRFGRWRAAQQAIRPGTMTAVRILVVVAAGTVAFGELEAARVYTAPTLLVVTGIGGFLFASFAAERHRPMSAMIRRADIGAITLFSGVMVVGIIATVLTPWAGRFVTKGDFSIDELAVFGWSLYAGTTALMMPYGGLAAVTGMHVRVFGLRLVEAVVSCVAVAVIVFPLEASPSWVPFALAAGAIVSGGILRQLVLVPQAHRTDWGASGATRADGSPSPADASA